MKKVTFAILAHVDAGKTTLSEAMLFHAGVIKKMGRVDKEDSFLDYDIQERKRGITIFSKEISFMYRESQMTFLDTPGHNDFSCEMERTLQVLDYAILVISAKDGKQFGNYCKLIKFLLLFLLIRWIVRTQPKSNYYKIFKKN